MIEKPWEKKNQLLDDVSSGKITMEDLEKECAYWFMECFSELHMKPYPTTPKRFVEFKLMSYEKQNKLGIDFWSHPEIKQYLELKDEIKNTNKANLYWLNHHMSKLPDGDFLAKQKFKEKILEFEGYDFS